MFQTPLSTIAYLLFHMVILIPRSLNEAAKTITCIAEQLTYEYENWMDNGSGRNKIELWQPIDEKL